MVHTYLGNIVQTPMNSGTNGGVDKCAAVVTQVGGAGSHGGIIVSITRFPNTTLTLLDHLTGAWPLDRTST